MRKLTIFVSVMFTLLMILATDARSKGEVYRWVDENGVVHFVDDPKGHKDAEKLDLQADETSGLGVNPGPATTRPGQASEGQQQEEQPSLAQQRRDERAAKHQASKQRQAEIARTCERAQQRVAQLEPSPQVLVRTEDGTIERLDDNKRLELLAESKTYINANCNK